MNHYNDVMSTKYTSIKSIIDNFSIWITIHSLEEMKQAIDKIPEHHFWKDKMSLEMLFRQKNPNGEKVDRIQELINYKPQYEGGKKLANAYRTPEGISKINALIKEKEEELNRKSDQ